MEKKISLKAKISSKISILRKYGYWVFNFQSFRANPTGSKGLPDFLIIGHNKIYFVEMKLKSTRDRFSEIQKEFRNFLLRQNFRNVFYKEVDESNYQELLEEILNDMQNP